MLSNSSWFCYLLRTTYLISQVQIIWCILLLNVLDMLLFTSEQWHKNLDFNFTWGIKEIAAAELTTYIE